MKSGFAVIIGRSNVGKSTLLNALVGTKIAITTDKPHTTRDVIHGVYNDARGQIVFVDTPGIFKGGRGTDAGASLTKVREALHGINLVIYVVDPTRALGAEERHTLSLIRNLSIPKILVVNKCDLERRPYHVVYHALGEQDFSATIDVSATRGTHLRGLVNHAFEILPEGEPFYPPEQRTNLRKEEWVAEIIREKALMATHDEVPYALRIVVDDIEETTTHDATPLFTIHARILTTADRYKKMVIGTGGHRIKAIGTAARTELENILQKKVFLDLQVENDSHR